jgi:hypothetical protein
MNKLKIYLISVLTFSNGFLATDDVTEAMRIKKTPTSEAKNNHNKGFFLKNWKYIIGIVVLLTIIGTGSYLLFKNKDDVVDKKIHNKP